jgi:hypothetical protein
MSAGALQMFASRHHSDAPGSTFYMAISHAVQTIPSLTPGCSRLSYTIGLGSGSFMKKALMILLTEKENMVPPIFGGISFEVIRHVSLNAEWTGMNLGFSAGIRPLKAPSVWE